MLLVAESSCVARLCASPNYGERIGRERPDSIVLHYTGMKDGASALSWLCDPASRVSCHYLVEEDGSVVQLVPEAGRAWHAGRARWKGESDINSASLGVEIVNGGHEEGLPAYPDRQIGGVIALCRDLVERYGIAPERVLAHSDVAPGRKRDPGERFPWAELHASGIGHWVPERAAIEGASLALGDQGPRVVALQASLARYGYAVGSTGLFDEAARVVVAAFQRHFRQSRVDGIADPGTVATLEDLLHALRPAETGSVSAPPGRFPTRA